MHLKSKYQRISFVGATYPCLRKETKLSILSYKSSSLDSADGGGIAKKDQNKRKERSVLWGGGHLCDGRAYFLNLRSFYCLRAHSLYAGFLTTSKRMKKTKDNLITKLALREVSSRCWTSYSFISINDPLYFLFGRQEGICNRICAVIDNASSRNIPRVLYSTGKYTGPKWRYKERVAILFTYIIRKAMFCR